MNSPTRLAGLAGVALLTALLAACGSDGGSPPASPAAASGVPAASAPVTVESASAAPERALPERKPGRTPDDRSLRDGTHEAHIVDVDAVGGRITVDVVQLLTGAEAARAAAEVGAEEVPPMNDYFVSNTSSRLRTLRLAPGAPITVNVHGAAESGSSVEDVSTTLPRLTATPHLEQGLFRLTVDDGRLTRIAEIYLP